MGNILSISAFFKLFFFFFLVVSVKMPEYHNFLYTKKYRNENLLWSSVVTQSEGQAEGL